MTPSMKAAYEELKKHGKLVRVKNHTRWLPEGTAPVMSKSGYGAYVANKDAVETQSLGRLADAGWAKFEDKERTVVRFVDRDAPLREAMELITEIPLIVDALCKECPVYPMNVECKDCVSQGTRTKAEAFLKKYGGDHV